MFDNSWYHYNTIILAIPLVELRVKTLYRSTKAFKGRGYLSLVILGIMTIILVTGAARSGKSEWAERIAANQDNQVIYVATAQIDPNDAEWQARITAHALRRPPDWQTVHCPFLLAETLKNYPDYCCFLVDSLGTWVANGLEQNEDQWELLIEDLIKTLKSLPNIIIFVAEETGWGVVPAYPMGRLFRDRLGNLSRRIGAIADQVYLVTGGYALDLTKLGERL